MNHLRLYLLCSGILLLSLTLNAQNVSISDNPAATPDASAMLDVQSTSKGMLVPRMTTTQRTAIANPAVGLLVFDVTTESFWFRDGSGWMQLVGNSPWNTKGDTIIYTPNKWVGIGLNDPQKQLHVRGEIAIQEIGGNDGELYMLDSLRNTRVHFNKQYFDQETRFRIEVLVPDTTGTTTARVQFFRNTDAEIKRVEFFRGDGFGTERSAVIGVGDENSFFQVSGGNLGIGTATPDANAILDVSSNAKGVLFPRMTSAKRIAISNPALGLLVFDTTTETFWFMDSSGWVELKSTAQGNALTSTSQAGGDISGVFSNLQIKKDVIGSNEIFDGAVGSAEIFDGAVGAAEIADGAIGLSKLAPGLSLPPNGPAGKDLSGTYPNPTVAQIQGQPVSSATPQQGQVMMFDNGQWKPISFPNREIAIFEETTPSSGGEGGGTATAGSNNRRKLNLGDNTPNISLNVGNNTFTLQPGKYIIQASAPAFALGKHQLILRNQVTDANVLLGTNEYNTSNGGISTSSHIYGIVVPSAVTTYRLDHWVEFSSSDPASLGLTHSGLSSGTSNYYSRVIIEKIQ